MSHTDDIDRNRNRRPEVGPTQPRGSLSEYTPLRISIAAAVFIALYLTRSHSYLLFHCLSELFTVVIACAIFLIAWNSRRFVEDSTLLLLGISFLFVGMIHLLHTLAYKGMNVFVVERILPAGLSDPEANLATQLWIAARYMLSLSLLAAPLVSTKRLRGMAVLTLYGVVTALVLASIFVYPVFPVCYSGGLTAFKKVSEYIVIGILALAAIAFYQRRDQFAPVVYGRLLIAIVLIMVAELAFTLYIGVYDALNMLGHLMSIVAFFLIYRALIEATLVQPYNVLFRDLSRSEEELRRTGRRLAATVRQRNAQLTESEASLVHEVSERLQAEEELHVTERRFKAIFDQTFQFIGLLEPDGTVLEINGTALDFGGLSQQDVVGKPFWDCAWWVDSRGRRQRVMKAVEMAAGGMFVRYETQMADRDSRLVAVDFSIKPITDDEDTVLFLICEARDISERNEANRKLRAYQARLRLLASQVALSEQKERRRIAAELHDYIGQTLAISKIRLTHLGSLVSSQAGESVEEISELIAQAIKYTRRLTTELGSHVLYEWGLAAALERLADDFRDRHGCAVTFEYDADIDPLQEDLAVTLFQSARELLFNVVKHAEAKHVVLSLHSSDGEVIVGVTDDGAGFDFSGMKSRMFDGDGFGLFSVRERILDMGGRVNIESQEGQGTSVTLSVPIAGKDT